MGDHIRKRRLDLGLSRRQVAEQIGVDQISVGNWENGWAKPRARWLEKIIAFLGTGTWRPPPRSDSPSAIQNSLSHQDGADSQTLREAAWKIGANQPLRVD